MGSPFLFAQPSAQLADCVAGVDEAGRGPLAGPVFAAAVVLGPGQTISGVRDSKRLSARKRSLLVADIQQQALGFALGRAEVEEIDHLNILQASLLAMSRALAALSRLPALVQIDGNHLPTLPGYTGRAEAVIGGDRSCPAISAASILAKVARDQEMRQLDEEFPGYGFRQHKGYPTAAHREALARLGACPAHRRSYRPVQRAIATGPLGP